MPSTPKHLELYKAFNWLPPAFAHVGLLQDAIGQKLSKRNVDTGLEHFKRDGIFPEALVNHLTLLGWSHSLGNDFLPLRKLIDNVSTIIQLFKRTNRDSLISNLRRGTLKYADISLYIFRGSMRRNMLKKADNPSRRWLAKSWPSQISWKIKRPSKFSLNDDS